MKKTIVLLALAVVMVFSLAAAASAADVSAAAVFGLASTVGPGASPLSNDFNVKANVLPKVTLTVPDDVNFGDVYPEDTGSAAYVVNVKSTKTFTLSRSYAAVNDLGASVAGDVDGGVSDNPGNRDYDETVSINVPWVADGAYDVPVTYTVVFP